MSAPTQPAQSATADSTSNDSTPTSPRLALPAPPSSAEEEAIKLDVGTGEAVSLYDRLGPTVVNSDGVSYLPSPPLSFTS
jgi:hypothetical protein